MFTMSMRRFMAICSLVEAFLEFGQSDNLLRKTYHWWIDTESGKGDINHGLWLTSCPWSQKSPLRNLLIQLHTLPTILHELSYLLCESAIGAGIGYRWSFGYFTRHPGSGKSLVIVRGHIPSTRNLLITKWEHRSSRYERSLQRSLILYRSSGRYQSEILESESYRGL